MMWERMLARLRPQVRTDDELKRLAQRETERLMAQLRQWDIKIELATERQISDFERELREAAAQLQ